MLGRLLVVMAIFTFAHLSALLANEYELFQDYENSNAISSREDLSPSDVNDKRLQYFLWIKRAADGARSGGMGRSKQLRYHHCYFNPISCFRKRAIESSQLPESYTGTL
ncbi:hypothetical protein GHT06_005066 [Daphnia sinensis]|uniref:Prohormone-1 n=1 Tax=Daphnia sinensis TaxID=1820382 RepID=A0AAD5KF65_9CRUS|nr:hypothetical protein GHT06_005066 [Daphnia sinensis]